MAQRNIFAGLVLLGLSIWYVVLINGLPNRSLPNTPGPSFFPWIIAIATLVLSAALLIKGLLQHRKGGGADVPLFDQMPNAASLLGLFAGYLVAFPYAGFELATMPVFACLMYLFGARKWLLILPVSILTPLALAFLFREIFQILLPRGIW